MKHVRLLLAVILSAGTLFAGEIVRTREVPESEIGLPASVAVGDPFSLKLFDDVEMTLTIVAKPPAGIAGQSFIAKDDSGSASAIVKFSGNTARISIDDFMNRRQYTVRVKNGTATITERDNSQMDDGECGTCGGDIEVPQPAVEETKTTSTKKSRTLLGASGNEFPLAAQKSVVDILVAFDQGAKAKSSELGYDTIEDFADYAVNKMNTVLENSQLDNQFCYRLVGVTEIDDTWTKIDNALLLSMRAREGKFAKLSQLRDKCGADTITLLINRGSGTTSGIGFEYGTNNNTKAIYTPSQFDGMNYACNVCDINTVYSRYTMSHETGHNMGCGHSNRQGSNSGPGRYSDSCGYHFTDTNNVRRSTVMAYTYTGDDNEYYKPVPYFSTPDISPTEYGCALGITGVNNNRGTLMQTYTDIAGLREHMLPYDWDVRFLDDNGKDIPDGTLFYGSTYVTLSNANANAAIYYTLDGSTPTTESWQGDSGTKVYMYLTGGSKTLTACAVVDGKAQSVRSITLRDGLTWSGDSSGNGLWLSGDSSVRTWNGEYFSNGDAVRFDDLSGISSATVTVKGAVAPSSVSFSAVNTAYTFDKGDDDANISIPDASFAPAGDVTFNLPVQLAAKTFTSMTGCALTFNAPFGQTVDAANGNCTNMISISHGSTLTVAPGMGNTQTFGRFDTSAPSTATFRAGAGDVVFNGPYDGGNGVFGDAQVIIGEGANVTFNCAAATGFNKTSPFTIEKGAIVSFNGSMEHMRRPLYLNGGTINASARFDRMYAAGITVNDDSVIAGNGYMLIRYADEQINVVDGKSLTFNIPTQDGSNTKGWGIIKRGRGTIVANKELKHSGVTDIEEGTVTIGYSSNTAIGSGWTVSSGARLKVNKGKLLTVPSLTLESGSIIAVAAAETAQLVVTGAVSIAGVSFELEGVAEFNVGDKYPLIKSNKSISKVTGAKTSSLPKLSNDLRWKLEEEDGVLYAKVLEKPVAADAVDFTSNSDTFTLDVPDDAKIGANGGAVLDASPIVVDGLDTKLISMAVKIVVSEAAPSEVSTICAWRLGAYVIYCVREANGTLSCRWIDANGDLKTNANSVTPITLTPGEHLVQVGYYSYTDNNDSSKNGGTRVLLDGEVAYFANGLKFSNEKVSKVTFGATAEETPRFPYAGLEIIGAGVMDLTDNTPAGRMTSNVDITYHYNKVSGIPLVFPGETGGGLGMDESLVEAAFDEKPTEAAVSVLASFPSDSVGVICGVWVQITSTTKCGAQAEYDGNGKFYIRSNDDALTSWQATRVTETEADVTKPHMYTLTYKDGEGFTFYQDGVALLRATSPYLNYANSTITSPITFGCSTYNTWSGTTFHDYPNPAKDLHVYASHIALGTSDRAVSESAVAASIATEEDCPEPPETPAVVDVLVAFDKGAQAYVANKSQTLEEFAAVQIGKMNDVLITNKLDRFYSYRLAGTCKVDATYPKVESVSLKLVSGAGPLVTLRSARELCGADTVTLLVNASGGATLGDSIPLSHSTDVASRHDCAFSVCSISAVDTGTQHTMIHENAHNMGCGHARQQGAVNSPFEYGRGYYFMDGKTKRHTIMAYDVDGTGVYAYPSPYFSTASKEFGFVLGDKTNNNARVLKETCGEVAKWREGSAIDFSGIELDGVTWQTSKKYPWYVDVYGFIRSFNQTDYTYQCTTPLKATIAGPKRLTFSHKSYFGGVALGGDNYSHFDVLVDDSPVFTQTECTNEWEAAAIDIPDGAHEVVFVFSQRYAMNNSSDNKDFTPEADDAVWLKDIALEDVQTLECKHSSTSDDVDWVFPYDFEATAIDDNLAGVEVGSKGIVESLNFSTNAVVLSVLAELPENGEGALMGLVDVSGSSKYPIFAYANGNGTFTIYYYDGSNKAMTSQSKTSKALDVTGLHVWTLAYVYNDGGYLYCDGELVASDPAIKWTNTHKPAECLTFGSAYTNAYPLVGMKIYAVHTDFGVGSAIFERTDDSADQTLQQLGVLADFAGQNVANQLAALNLYMETGAINPEVADSSVLRISEIMPKPTDALKRGALEGMDVNGLEGGWVEVENTSDQWADLADYRFIRVNRGKKTDPAGVGNFPSRLVPPRSRAIFYTSERYSNSKDQAVSAFEHGTFDGKPMVMGNDLHNILVWGDKVNPKKSPYVRLYYAPDGEIESVVDTVVIPSDVPEGYSIIVGEAKEGEGTRRWLCPTPTRGAANTATDALTRLGPNVGPLYEKKGQKKTEYANEFAVPVPPAKPGEDYVVTLPINGVMNPDGTFTPRAADKIQSLKFVFRKDLDDSTLVTNDIDMATKATVENWGDQYTATIPASYFPAAGHLMQWKVLITDGEGVEWTSPSFNNPDDGYEWYGTIVEPDSSQMSATLPTWHMFADSESLEQMDVDASDQTLANNARVAIYDSSTSNYYDYVRIDLRGNTSAKFTKKSHGLRFAKAHPLTMTDVVTGEPIEEIRKTSLISEFADPSYMRQMIAFWLWKKMGNLVPFDFPVRCNMNGEFYQLAFNSERFTDELIEDVYGLDKYGYGYKNVGTLKSGSGTTAGDIEKKTPDDEDEKNIDVLEDELRYYLKQYGAQSVGEDVENLTKFVVEKFNLPAWLNYLASARITQEMDDVWANVCAYYDNAEMKEGVRGTGTWMPLGYDFNLSFGQWYYNDVKGTRFGLMSNQDWYKSHPFYGGNRVRCWKQSDMIETCNYGNDGFEAVWQSAKFRRLYLRRLRTLMDQELKAPGTAEADTPFMAKMRDLAELMQSDAALDQTKWQNDSTDDAIDVWPSKDRPANMDAGIDDIWNNYVVLRREHLYVTHSVTNTAKEIGYDADLNAGIPEAQSPVEALAPNISISNLTALDADDAEALGVAGQLYDTEVVVIRNDNDEVVDMSGWRLAFSVDFTFPAGTVCDANDSIYVVADRRAYVTSHSDELTDQVIVGNATFTGAGPVALYDADGVLVYSAIPQTDELKYLRLHSFYGNTLDDGDTGEWFTLTNISDSATLDLAGVTVCFLKQGDPEESTAHCHVTLENKKGKGSIAPFKSWTASQADYTDKGWEKIQNNKQQITIYDKYGSVCQSLKVTQKKFPLAYGNGGYLVCDSTDASVASDSQWHEALPNNGESSEPFDADSQEAADELIANAMPALTQDDAEAGLETQYLKIVAEPVEGSPGKYTAAIVVNPETVKAPIVAGPAEEGEPVEVEEDNDGNTTVSVTISNVIQGLWYGYEVSDALGESAVFGNDVNSFYRATNATHKVKGSPRTAPSGFFRIKVLPAKPSN